MDNIDLTSSGLHPVEGLPVFFFVATACGRDDLLPPRQPRPFGQDDHLRGSPDELFSFRMKIREN